MKSSFHQWYSNSLTAGLSPESEQYREVRTTDGAVTVQVGTVIRAVLRHSIATGEAEWPSWRVPLN